MKKTISRTALGALTFALLSAVSVYAAPKPNPASQNQRWPAENLSGTIDMVIPAQHLVVVKDSTGTTFDFVVNPRTQIMDNGRSDNLAGLSSKMNDQVQVHFIPESKGDIARTIHIEQ